MAGNNQADSNSTGSGNEPSVQTPETTKIVSTEAKSTGLVPADASSGSGQEGASGKDSGGQSAAKGSGSGKGGGGKSDFDKSKGVGKGKGKSTESKLQELKQFMGEVVIEFKKITWPTRDQVFRETMSVLVLVAILTLLLLSFDWVLSQGIFQPIESWARMHGGGIGRGY